MAFSKLDALASVAELLGGHDEKGRCETKARGTRRRVPARAGSNGEAGGFHIHERGPASEYGTETSAAKDGCTSPPLDSNKPALIECLFNGDLPVPAAAKVFSRRGAMERVGADSMVPRECAAFSEPGACLQQHLSATLKRSPPFQVASAKDAEDTWTFPPAKRRNAISAGGSVALQQCDIENPVASFGFTGAGESANEHPLQLDGKQQQQPQARYPALPRWSDSLGNIMANTLASGAPHRIRHSNRRPSAGLSGVSDEPCSSSHYVHNSGAFVGRNRTSAGSYPVPPQHHQPNQFHHDKLAHAAQPEATKLTAAAAAARTACGTQEEPARVMCGASPEASALETFVSPGVNHDRLQGGERQCSGAAAAASSYLPKPTTPAAAATAGGVGNVDSDPAAYVSMMAQSPSKGGPDLLEKMRIAEALLTHRDKLSPRMLHLVIQQLAVLCQSASVDDLVSKLAVQRSSKPGDVPLAAGDGRSDMADTLQAPGPGISRSNSGRSNTQGDLDPGAAAIPAFPAACGPGPVAAAAPVAAAVAGVGRAWVNGEDRPVAGEEDGTCVTRTQPNRRSFKPWRGAAQAAAGPSVVAAIEAAAAGADGDEQAAGSTSSSSSSSRTAAKGATQPHAAKTESTLTGPRSQAQHGAADQVGGDAAVQRCSSGPPMRARAGGASAAMTTRGGVPTVAADVARRADRVPMLIMGSGRVGGGGAVEESPGGCTTRFSRHLSHHFHQPGDAEMSDDLMHPMDFHSFPAPGPPNNERLGGAGSWDMAQHFPCGGEAEDGGAASAMARRGLARLKRQAAACQPGSEYGLLPMAAPAAAQQQLELEAEAARPAGEPLHHQLLSLERVLDLTSGQSSTTTTAALIAALAHRARTIAGMGAAELDSIAAQGMADYNMVGLTAAQSLAPGALQPPPVALRRRQQLHAGKGADAVEERYGGMADLESSPPVGRWVHDSPHVDEMAGGGSGAVAAHRRPLSQELQKPIHSTLAAIPKSTVAVARRAFAAVKAATGAANGAAANGGSYAPWTGGSGAAADELGSYADAPPVGRLQRAATAAGAQAPLIRQIGRIREGLGPSLGWSASGSAGATGRGLDLHRCSTGSGGAPLSPDAYVTIRLPDSLQAGSAAGKAYGMT